MLNVSMSFNRTIAELKSIDRAAFTKYSNTFNRTIAELKYGSNMRTLLLRVLLIEP